MDLLTILMAAFLVSIAYWIWPPAGIFVLTFFLMTGLFLLGKG